MCVDNYFVNLNRKPENKQYSPTHPPTNTHTFITQAMDTG